MPVLPIIAKAKALFSGGNGSVIEKIGNAIDKTFTNKEEVLQMKNELTKIQNEHEQKLAQIEVDMEKEISSRWDADMASDSWLSKNVRPLSLISLLAFTYIIIITDSCNIPFEVKGGYIDLLEALLLTIVMAYFSGRSLEKYQSIRSNKK